MIALLIAATLLAPSGSTPDKSKLLVLEMPVSPETAEGQARIAKQVLELCGGGYPKLGRYRFSGLEKVGGPASFRVEQEFTCLDAPPVAEPERLTDPDWRPTAADEEHIQALTKRYFTMFDSGDPAEIFRIWSEENRQSQTGDEFAASLLATRRELGKPVNSRIAKLTWYVNPANAPRPGIYVAADYERSYSVVPVVCGYVIWFRRADGSYELAREERNRLALAPGETLTPEKRVELRALLGCPPEAQ